MIFSCILIYFNRYSEKSKELAAGKAKKLAPVKSKDLAPVKSKGGSPLNPTKPVKFKWTNDDIVLLIQEVEEHECLYNTSLKEYKDVIMKGMAAATIAKNIGCSKLVK